MDFIGQLSRQKELASPAKVLPCSQGYWGGADRLCPGKLAHPEALRCALLARRWDRTGRDVHLLPR